MIRCSCGESLALRTIEECEEQLPFVRYECHACQYQLGVEGDVQEISRLFSKIEWTDEAQHALDRLPPYVEQLVCCEVEAYAEETHVRLVTRSFMVEAQNRGNVVWNPDAERRLSKVPAPVRAMARVELERTALDRGLPEVSVALMEEIKARYFGMAAPSK